MKLIKITKKIQTWPQNRPEVGGVYEVVRQAPGQYGPILFIKVGETEVGVLDGEYEPTEGEEPRPAGSTAPMRTGRPGALASFSV